MAGDSETTLLIKIKEKGKEVLDGIGEAFAKMKIAILAVGAAIAGFAALAIKNYAEAERASNALDAAIKAQGLLVSETADKYKKWASAIQKKSTFGDDEIVQAQALMQSMVGNIELTEELTQATIDFAAAQGIDLQSAFSLVGKSIGSNINGLARYGIEVDTALPKTDKMAALVESLGSHFGGAAEAQAKGLGSLKQLSNAFGDFMEVIGKELAPVITFTAKLLTAFVEDLQKVDASGLSSALKAIAIWALDAKKLMANLVDEVKSLPGFVAAAGKAFLATIKLDFKAASEIMVKEDEARVAAFLENEKTYQEELSLLLQAHAEQTINKQKEIEDQKIIIRREKEREADAESREAFDQLIEIKKNMEKRALDERVKQREEAEKAEAEAIKNMAMLTQGFITGGFQSAASGAVKLIAGTVIPGFENAAGALFDLLSKNSQQFAEMLNQIFSVEFLNAIMENLIVLIEELPGIISDIIDFIAENMPAIVQRLIEAIIANLPEIASAMIKMMTTFLFDPRFHAELAAAIAKGTVAGIKDAIGDITEAFRKALKDAANVLNIGGGGDGGGIISGIKSFGKKLGFEHGGYIPHLAHGGLIDNTLVAATPGEFVVNRASARANSGLLSAINASNGRSVSANEGITINVFGGLLGDSDSARQFARAVDKELFRLRQGNESRAFDTATFR